jgi:uncharacterized protein with PIN domain
MFLPRRAGGLAPPRPAYDDAVHPAAPRFLVDGMAVRLGKYLRCLGYDATWHAGEGTRALARRAELEGRVLLTRNSRLGTEIVPPSRCLVLASDDPVVQLRETAREFALDCEALLFTRCIRCNVALVDAEEREVADRVPEAVRARHAQFFRCPSCASVFWRGSHVVNTCAKLGLPQP